MYVYVCMHVCMYACMCVNNEVVSFICTTVLDLNVCVYVYMIIYIVRSRKY